MSYLGFDIRKVDEHYEVFDSKGEFCFSTDTLGEAIEEIEIFYVQLQPSLA